VHKIRRKEDGCMFALKVMPPPHIPEPTRGQLYLKAIGEAKLSKNLPTSKHLVKCVEYFSSPTHVLVVMELYVLFFCSLALSISSF
jgi:hypothetical protein